MTQQPMSQVLAQPISMHCVDQLGFSKSLETSFEYDPGDPYAVTIGFPAGDDVIRWSFCRSLLSRGITDPVGEGDVQLWPSTDENGRSVVMLEFRSPSGHLLPGLDPRGLPLPHPLARGRALRLGVAAPADGRPDLRPARHLTARVARAPACARSP